MSKALQVVDFTKSLPPQSLLTPTEKKELDQAEQVVRKGLDGFLEVGNALALIREQRLYREVADTFDAYLFERWGIMKAHGYRLIRAADAVAELKRLAPSVEGILPKKERPIRALLELPGAKEQLRVLKKGKELAGLKEVTTKEIEEARELLGYGKTKKPVKRSPKDEFLKSVAKDLRSILASLKKKPGCSKEVARLYEVLENIRDFHR